MEAKAVEAMWSKGNNFGLALAQTVAGCLYRDMVDAYYAIVD